MPAVISPTVRSRLMSSAAAGGGTVHGEATSTTCGELFSVVTISVPTARAAGLSTPSRAATVTNICTSPWPNVPVSVAAARDDSAAGSWKPPGERLSATGIPNTASARVSSAAATVTRRGAARANRAILFSKLFPQ